MIDNLKIENFLQDFGCAKLEHLQILFGEKNNNFKGVLRGNNVSKKENIFVHNTRIINNNMLVSLDILCEYKKRKRLNRYYLGYEPVIISFPKQNSGIIVQLDNTEVTCLVRVPAQFRTYPHLYDKVLVKVTEIKENKKFIYGYLMRII